MGSARNTVWWENLELRVVRVMYLSPPATDERISTGLNIRLAMLAAFAGVVFFGIYPTPLLRLAKTAADVLL